MENYLKNKLLVTGRHGFAVSTSPIRAVDFSSLIRYLRAASEGKLLVRTAEQKGWPIKILLTLGHSPSSGRHIS